MGLKACRACGAWVSKGAFACPRCGHPPGRRYGCGTGCLLPVLLLALAGLVGGIGRVMMDVARSTRPPGEPSGPAPGSFRPGDMVALVGNGPVVGLAINETDYDRMCELQDGNGPLKELAELVVQGRIVLADGGCPAVVVDAAASSLNVRLLDGRHAGRTGWVRRTAAVGATVAPVPPTRRRPGRASRPPR